MIKKPKQNKEDLAYTIAKVGISILPVVGGPAAEIFSAVVTPPIVKRRDEWIESLVIRLEEMEERVKGFKLEDLSANEEFISAVSHATVSAARTHQKEKLDALRNAVLNVALKNEINYELQQIFLNYIDYFTPLHIRLLTYFSTPKNWCKKGWEAVPSLKQVMILTEYDVAFPELKHYKNFINQLVEDIINRGLLSIREENDEEGIYNFKTSSLGNLFLAFINSPKEVN